MRNLGSDAQSWQCQLHQQGSGSMGWGMGGWGGGLTNVQQHTACRSPVAMYLRRYEDENVCHHHTESMKQVE